MTSYGAWEEHDDRFDIDSLLRRAIELVETSKSMPLSNSVILPRDEIRDLLAACIDNLPTEIRQANWMLRERAEFLEKMEREGEDILHTASDRAERMVQRSELVREAQRTAQRTVDAADAEARKLRHEAEDYVDQRLAEFEVSLEKMFRIAQAGREKLRGPAIVDLERPMHEEESQSEDEFFDQERR